MRESMKKYFRTGLVYFMAYPFAMTGKGDIEGTVRRVLEDTYFDYIELTRIEDPTVRATVARLVREACVGVAYGAQPQLMRNGENLCSLDESLRRRGVLRMFSCVDEAYEMGAEGIAFLAGKFDPQKVEEHYQQLVRSTKEICDYVASKGAMAVNLEVFDHDVEKCSLIGPATLAQRYAREIRAQYSHFGLMADLSHITQLHETLDQNLSPIAPYLRHAHIANAVLLPGQPAYGDQHPRFGFPNSEVDVCLLANFLRKLFEIGYLGQGRRPVISFEVKPWENEDPEMVLAGAKRTLDQAWALLEV